MDEAPLKPTSEPSKPPGTKPESPPKVPPRPLRPTPEPGWKIGLLSYPSAQAQAALKRHAPAMDAIRLIPDLNKDGYYWLTWKEKPKQPVPGQQPQETSRGQARTRPRAQSKAVHRKGPYEILGVSSRATLDEVTRAYHREARKNHPDKVATMGPEFRDLAERKMKELNAAYEELKKHLK